MSTAVTLSLATVLGLLAGRFFSLPPVVCMFTASFFSVAAVLAAKQRAPLSNLLMLQCAFFAVGWSRSYHTEPNLDNTVLQTCTRRAFGMILDPRRLAKDFDKIVIQTDHLSSCLDQAEPNTLFRHRTRLFVTSPKGTWQGSNRGDQVQLVGELQAFRPTANSNPRTSVRIQYSTFVEDPSDFQVHPQSGPNIFALFDKHRYRLMEFWYDALPSPVASFAVALSLGDSRNLEKSDREALRNTGTSHLVSVSGLHLGLLALFVFVIIRNVLRRTTLAALFDVGAFAAGLTLPAIIGFTFLTGAKIPVVRACIMASSILLSKCLGRHGNIVQAFAIAATTIAFLDPSSLESPGFQLSFGAVLGFLLFLNSSRRIKTREPTLLNSASNYVFAVMKTTAVATAITSPIAYWHFGSISLVALVTNLVAVPICSLLVMPLVLVTTVMASCGAPFSHFLAKITSVTIALLNNIIHCFDSVPMWHPQTIYLGLVGALGLGAVLLLLVNRKIRAALVCAVASLLLVITASLWIEHKNKELLTVEFLDIGQGDSILVRYPSGENWLIDAGGHNIVSYLQSQGIQKLDVLVLTHPHPDHIAGAPHIIEQLRVSQIWDTGEGLEIPHNRHYAQIRALAKARNIPMITPSDFCGVKTMKDVSIEVLHPCGPHAPYDLGYSTNDNSIVMRIQHKTQSFLLTGDIEADAEELILERHRLQPVQVLKLPHHGSSSSSTKAFLRALKPKYAIANTGLGNKYRFPSAQTVARLKELGTRLYQTDLHGQITVKSDGNSIQLESTLDLAAPSR